MRIGNNWRVYLKPFTNSGVYSSSWIDVTKDVDFEALGEVAQDLDNTDFNIGVYRNNNFNLTLRNDNGQYSDVGSAKTIFQYKRADTLCRITWEPDGETNVSGFAVCGEFIASLETDIFIGLLNDDSFSMDLDSQEVSFTVMGRESMMNRTAVPFGSLSNGELISAVIYACLNQSQITGLLTVSALNISVGSDFAIDDISPLQNRTVQDVLADLLLISNSVLYISADTVFVAPRTPTAAVTFHFYGQASKVGVENIQNLRNIKSGIARVFNYLSWSPSNVLVTDSASTGKYGVRDKNFDLGEITNTAHQASMLSSILSEFSNPKQEFDLYTPLNYKSLAINLLDRVDVDYPTVLIPGDFPVPVCGAAVCGNAVLPRALWSFTVDTSQNYKVIGKSLDIRTALYRLKLRLI